MDITVPMFVAENLFSALSEEGLVYYADPKAPAYALRHLEQVRQPIGGALAILTLHGEDVAGAAEELRAWIKTEAERLGRQGQQSRPKPAST